MRKVWRLLESGGKLKVAGAVRGSPGDRSERFRAKEGSVSAVWQVAERFSPRAAVVAIHEVGRGNVHDTYRVSLDSEDPPFILQRLNTRVFPNAREVMENIVLVTGHVRRRLQTCPLPQGRRFEMPRLLVTPDGLDHWVGEDGSFWRAMTSIEGARPLDAVEDETQGEEVGWALGLFHRLIADIPVERLHDTLPGFHETPRYLARLDNLLDGSDSPRSPEESRCLQYIERWRGGTAVLEDAKKKGRLSRRPIHGDPKAANFLMDSATRRAVSLIDLDTVKPGLVQYDIGDCLRSCCNRQGEDPPLWESVDFDTELCRAVLKGYLGEGRTFFTAADYEHVYDAMRLIPYELGVRFFSDHLEGDVYFKVRYPGHNLARALVQFRLAERVESRRRRILMILRELRGP